MKRRKRTRVQKVISKRNYERLLDRCRVLPATEVYLIDDYVVNLLFTVLDLRLMTVTVERAIEHYRTHCAGKIRTCADLTQLLESWSN